MRYIILFSFDHYLLIEWKRIDERYTLENSYLLYRDIENGNEESFEDELYKILEEKSIQYEYTYIGGFDSPGYELSCYCLSIVEDGKLYTFPIKFEMY